MPEEAFSIEAATALAKLVIAGPAVAGTGPMVMKKLIVTGISTSSHFPTTQRDAQYENHYTDQYGR